MYEGANHLDVVTRNDHLLCRIGGALGEGQTDSHIRGPQEELWSIALSEGSVSSSFLLGQNLKAWMSKCAKMENGNVDERRFEPGTFCGV